MTKTQLCFFILLLFSGCGKVDDFSSEEDLKFHRLKPQKETYHYLVENIFSLHSQAASSSQPDAAKTKLPDQTWETRVDLKLDLSFKGYQKHTAYSKWPLAVFDMKISDLKHHESDRLPDWLWSWEEQIGDQPPVKFKVNGLEVKKPMGEMLGDPRDYFFKGDSQLSLTPMGTPARRADGRLISRLQILDHPAFIGQYFLRGLPLDEMLHRCICPLPPISFKDEMQWEQNHLSHLKGNQEQKDREMWKAKLTEKDGKKLWYIEMRLQQKIPQGESKIGKAAFQYWTLERQLTAWVNPEDRMCEELILQEGGSWVDALSFQNSQQKMQHLPHQHRFKNRIHVRRP